MSERVSYIAENVPESGLGLRYRCSPTTAILQSSQLNGDSLDGCFYSKPLESDLGIFDKWLLTLLHALNRQTYT